MNTGMWHEAIISKRLKFLVSGPGAFFLAVSFSALAQSAVKIPRIGYLATGSPIPVTSAFVEGLRELGYVEGQNIIVEYRFAEGKEDRLSQLATDLLTLKPDIIVVANTRAGIAVRQLTSTVPIVLTDSADPIRAGLVVSLSAPAGNITGSSFMSRELGGKQLEVLKDIMPRSNRVAVVSQELNPRRPKLSMAAQKLRLKLFFLKVQDPTDVEAAFSEIVSVHADSVIVLSHPLIALNRTAIVKLAVKRRLPVVYPNRTYVEAGGLISYGVDRFALFRRAAYFVDRIVKGAKPADLPVEQPTKFELVVNLKAAKHIGITIPDGVLRWADEVIE